LSAPRTTIIKSESGNGLRSALTFFYGARMRQPVLGIRQSRDVFRRVAQRHQRFPAW
jgi:hypothetical protein